jgi:hypothetical protein
MPALAAGAQVRIETVDVGDPHPNTYRLTLRNAREQHTLIAISTGGGMMEVIRIDGLPVHMDGGWHETLVWLPKGAPCAFEGADEVTRARRRGAVAGAGEGRLVSFRTGLAARSSHCWSNAWIAPVLPVPSRGRIRPCPSPAARRC